MPATMPADMPANMPGSTPGDMPGLVKARGCVLAFRHARTVGA